MRPLVAVRRSVPFDPDFIGRHPLLWPVARAARAIGSHGDFPPVDALGRVFEGANVEAPVRFVAATPRRRRGERPDPRMLYDARIVLDAEVPTRGGCWHDLMNALVWGTFPRSKLALHTRQHRAIEARVAPGARTLPATRSRELDALALFDEGGVALLAPDPTRLRSAPARGRRPISGPELASDDVDAVVFGHAIYESLVLGVRPAVVAGVVVERTTARGATDIASAVDQQLATLLRDPEAMKSPSELVRVDLDLFSRRPSPRASSGRRGGDEIATGGARDVGSSPEAGCGQRPPAPAQPVE